MTVPTLDERRRMFLDALWLHRDKQCRGTLRGAGGSMCAEMILCGIYAAYVGGTFDRRGNFSSRVGDAHYGLACNDVLCWFGIADENRPWRLNDGIYGAKPMSFPQIRVYYVRLWGIDLTQGVEPRGDERLARDVAGAPDLDLAGEVAGENVSAAGLRPRDPEGATNERET